MLPNPSFDQLAMLVSTGWPIVHAASEIEVSESTARRWAATSEFRDRVAELNREAIDRALGALGELSLRAAATLGRIMDDPSAKNADRVRAANAILTHTARLRDLKEQDRRIEHLEDVVEGRLAPSNTFSPEVAEEMRREMVRVAREHQAKRLGLPAPVPDDDDAPPP